MLSIKQIRQKLIACEQLEDTYHTKTAINQHLIEKNRKEQKQLNEYLSLQGIARNAHFRAAAVLVPLVLREKSSGDKAWHLILTKRADHLKHHAGEISFPGGRQESRDQDLIQTALRESEEEIGLSPQTVEVLGRLPKQKTISQYHVTPYVAAIPSDSQFKIDKNEVASVFEVPLEFAMNTANHQQVKQTINQRSFSFYVIHYHQHRIWGATARMLVNLSYRLNPQQ